jgi:hypothetical protein
MEETQLMNIIVTLETLRIVKSSPIDSEGPPSISIKTSNPAMHASGKLRRQSAVVWCSTGSILDTITTTHIPDI